MLVGGVWAAGVVSLGKLALEAIERSATSLKVLERFWAERLSMILISMILSTTPWSD